MSTAPIIRPSSALLILFVIGFVVSSALASTSQSTIFFSFAGLCSWGTFVLLADLSKKNRWSLALRNWHFLEKRSSLIRVILTGIVSIWCATLLLQGTLLTSRFLYLAVQAFLQKPTPPPVIGGVAFLLIGFAMRFLQQLAKLSRTDKQEELHRHWASVLFISSMACAVLVFVERTITFPLSHYVALLLLILTSTWILETAFRSLARLYQTRKVREKAPPLGDPLLLGLLFKKTSPSDSTEGSSFLEFSISSLWFVREFRRAAIPFFCLTLLVTWLSTSLTIIPPGHSGVRESLGQLDDGEPLQSGMHLSYPLPLGKIHSISTAEIREMVIGFESDTGEPILWAEPHYIGEKMLLAEDGDQLLTLGVPILYRIHDLRSWLIQSTDAEKGLQRIASQEVQRHSLRENFFDTITGNRVSLEDSLRSSMQKRIDTSSLGIEIVRVCLRDIHPPVETVRSYQDVVSAEEEKLALIHRAEASYQREIPIVKMEEFRLRTDADAWENQRIAAASGSADSFLARQHSFRLDPELFQLRTRMEVSDLTMQGKQKLVIDKKMTKGTSAMVDVRKLLSSPPIESALPTKKETLVPSRESESPEAAEIPFRPIEIEIP